MHTKLVLRVDYLDVQIRTFPIQSHFLKCTDTKRGDLESHGPFGGFLKVKRNLEIVSKLAIFEASRVQVGEAVGVGGV